ncbi:MAG: HDOD domain-containing protein [Oceanospirillum sp.]|nr:HDOD domain-containing protein [Oceanospirillum sp.]MDX1398854.1 HDOD domain-containing protein [Oceanospirillum sp.]
METSNPGSAIDERYKIPSRPEAVIAIAELMKAKNPSASEIADILKQDVFLYTSVLAAVNTPLFRLSHKITDLTHAITLLGLDKLFAVIRLAALQNSMGKLGRLDRFWDTATEVAQLSADITTRVSDLDPHDSYTLGMMHDCAIPLMLESHPEYKAFLRDINGADLFGLTTQEEQRFGTNHFALGAQIARHWFMPDRIADAVEGQAHYSEILDNPNGLPDQTKSLLCILVLAKDISSRYRRFWRIYDSKEYQPELQKVLRFLGIPDIEYMDIREDLLHRLEEQDLGKE